MGQHRPCAEPCVVSGGTAQSSGLTRESWAPGRTPDLYTGVTSPLPCASLEHAWGLSPRRGDQLGTSEKQHRAGILWNLTGEVQPELEEKLAGQAPVFQEVPQKVLRTGTTTPSPAKHSPAQKACPLFPSLPPTTQSVQVGLSGH